MSLAYRNLYPDVKRAEQRGSMMRTKGISHKEKYMRNSSSFQGVPHHVRQVLRQGKAANCERQSPKLPKLMIHHFNIICEAFSYWRKIG